MYLINKDETEHTGQVRGGGWGWGRRGGSGPGLGLSRGGRRGLSWPPLTSLPRAPQESYVWKMYQERCWDFFPAGDCFRKQYEDQLS